MSANTLTFILAGGAGSRLAPLTADRAKPAVPFGGKYRIIDFALANCLHSGMRRILILTQYKSHSLHKHLRDGWSVFNPELGEYVTVVPPQMRSGDQWYQGTADAIWQNRYLLERSGAEYVLILSGDHIYRMDYAAMVDSHKSSGADVTIACMKVPVNEAHQFGVLSIDESGKIGSFIEKPSSPEPIPGDDKHAMVSMGIYLFKREVLMDSLGKDASDVDSSHDFGKDVIPDLLKTVKLYSYEFGGGAGRVSQDRYWRDVGTLDSFYEANMSLLDAVPALDLYQPDWPIRTYQAQTPPARTVPSKDGNEGIFINSILGGGSIISGGCVQQSVLFQNVFVGDESIVEDSIVFDSVSIGERVEIKRCILDKDTVVPDDIKLGFDLERDRKYFSVTDKGVVVIPKKYDFTEFMQAEYH